jgi:phage antirepressor YoqD-like protein
MKKVYGALVLSVMLMGFYGCQGASTTKTETVTPVTPKAQETKTEVTKTEVTTTADAVKVGDNVAAEWMTDSWYLATVKKVTGDKYDVDYADNTSGSVTLAQIKTLDKNLKLAVGDKVMAVWSNAKFYTGAVQDLKEGGATIKWDDGSSPSFVELGKIYK